MVRITRQVPTILSDWASAISPNNTAEMVRFYCVNAVLVYEFMVDGKKVVARYSYVFKNINNRMRIVNHHSSELVEI
jgi:hypothetical protein